jgi:membrane protein
VEPAGEKPQSRARAWAAGARERRGRIVDRVEVERGRHSSLDATLEMVDRDVEVGGGIIAGALAYRLFIWLLPLALVLVAGLGIAADGASESPEEAAKSIGLAGLVSQSIAGAANSSARWYALLVGVPVLLWATRSVLRALIGAHRLVWRDVRASSPRPTPAATLRFFGLLVCLGFVTLLGVSVRSWSGLAGVFGSAFVAIPYAGLWWLIALRLPHRDAPATALLPGALLFGVGSEVLHSVVVYVITPYAISKQGTYGALGVAATLLFGMYLLCRVVVASAVLNATLWERRSEVP